MGLAQQPFRCPSCGGIWLRVEDAERLGGDPRFTTLGTEGAAEAPSADHRAGLCPEGHGILSRARVAAGQGFFLDRCTTCFGIWFDGGEWSQLASRHLLGDLRLFWSSTWQAQEREKRREAEYQDWLRARLGEPLFQELAALATRLRGHPSRSEALAFLQHELHG
jgi:Zn-finger nucleic acid-binding protein